MKFLAEPFPILFDGIEPFLGLGFAVLLHLEIGRLWGVFFWFHAGKLPGLGIFFKFISFCR